MPTKAKPDPLLEIKEMLKSQQASMKEIRDLLTAQKLTIEEHPAHPRFGRRYLRYLAIVSVIALTVGGLGAYQYYKVLQSIIDQYPV
jgi:hypothetical protein